MSVSRIRIGIYGASGAGKTRFFRQLVRENSLPVQPGSRLANFLAAASAADGTIVPTTTSFENIDIKIGPTNFVINDGKGELLSPTVRRTASVDALMFFFDPSGGHDSDERLRAKQLIDHVLETRQNRLLPIVFVLTHRDRWTPEQTRLAEEWINQITDYQTDAFSKTLRNHFPPTLTWKEYVFHTVSSADGPSSKDLPGVMEHIRILVEHASRFRRRDRWSSLWYVVLFLFCLLLMIGIPLLCFTSPTIRKTLVDFHDKAAPILHLPMMFDAEPKIDLDPLFDGSGELSESETRTLNRSLFLLMKKLNKIEDGNQPPTDDDHAAAELWNRAVQTIRDRFAGDSASDRLDRYAILLHGLIDTPKRQPRILNETLRDYWTAYRQHLLGELQRELTIHREASASATQILSALCVRLEMAFRDVTESGVRGDAVSGTAEETSKESLKQDIRKAFIACRNYMDHVPVEIVVVSVSLESDREIDRDIHRRLVFSGGRDKGEVFIDLTIATGFQSDTPCSFLPSRKDFTLSFIPDRLLRVVVQGKPKGSQGEWSDITDWDLTALPSPEASLAPLGIPFYQKFENEENTSYSLSAEEYKLELVVRRPRNVPELLWQIVEKP